MSVSDTRYLNGIKGLASVKIFVFHLLITFYPYTYFVDEGSAGYEHPLQNIWGTTPLNYFLNGSFSVYVFWMLSGFCLSLHYLKTGELKDIQSKAVRRLIRLFPPATCAVIIGFILIRCNLTYNIQAYELWGG